MIHLFVKYRLKFISRRVIVNLYLFMIKKDMSRFKNNLLFIFIKYFVFKQFDLKGAFLKKIKKFD